MKSFSRIVSLGSHDLQEQLRTEIARRWPETQYPFHIQIISEEATNTVGVRVWTDDGIHIFEETDSESVSSSGGSSLKAAVLGAVELALREASSEKLAINQAVP